VDTARDSSDAAAAPPTPLVVTLITRGSPEQLTGGYLYHRRLAEAAPAHGAVVEFVSATPWHNPLRRARGVVVVDSIAAWSVVPWLRPDQGPIAAILHQPPGGVGKGRLRTALQHPLDRACYRRCDLLIAASTALAEVLVTHHRLPAELVRVIEPGCDLPAVRRPLADLRAGRRVALLCVANWLPNKGVLELLEAVAELASDRATLHLAGREDADPGYGARVRSRVAEPDLRDRVISHGPLALDEVAALYAAADAFVLPSYVETYGTVYGEALAAGLPTVGWAAGNLPNLVTDGVDGCLVEPADVDGLRAVLERLSVDDAWRAELAGAALRRGAALPTWSDAADTFFGALRQLTTTPG